MTYTKELAFVITKTEMYIKITHKTNITKLPVNSYDEAMSLLRALELNANWLED